MWLVAACSGESAPAPEGRGAPTERGLYRLESEPTATGVTLRLQDRRGHPVEDAALWPVQPGVLVEPGECDSVEEARCFHPGGIYVLRLPEPKEPVLELKIEADPGEDRAVVRALAP